MFDFGAVLLGHGIEHIILSGRGAPPYAQAFGVTHVAHAGELITKAAIAQKHPLLIFSSMPKLTSARSGLMSFDELASEGRSINYNELPDRLWAATGYAMEHVEEFKKFGATRNVVQHFAATEVDYLKEALSYTCNVLDPLMNHFWQVGPFKAMADAWDEQNPYILGDGVIREALEDREIAYNGWLPAVDG
ncbi:MAG: hypothetical protein RIM72_16335 [Alphaproteobacteria bacterium]